MNFQKRKRSLLSTFFLLLCISILAVGCSQSGTDVQPSTPTLPAFQTPPLPGQGQVNDAKDKISQHFHMFLSQLTAPRKTSGSDLLIYHQGPTMQLTSVNYAIFWEPPTLPDGTATHVSPTYNSLIKRYFQDVGGTGLYQNNTQYYDTHGHILNSSFFGGAWVDTSSYPFPAVSCFDPLAPHGCLTDREIQDEVTRAMRANHWTAGINHLFYVFTSWGEGSCFADFNPTQCAFTAYCAYHSYYTLGNQAILYANMPYTGTQLNGCGVKHSPNNDIDADSTINVTSHEHIEAVTDPHLNAWYDANGSEIGDKCAWKFGSLPYDAGQANQKWNGHYYIIQQEWSNRIDGCTSGY